MQFTPFMLVMVFLSFVGISFSMGILMHAAFMYADEKKDTRKSWILCMVAGTGITLWMFGYGYYVNFFA